MDAKKDVQTKKNATVRTVFMAVVSVVAALLLWVYVTETQGEDIEKSFTDVRVVFKGETELREDRELIISDPSTNSVRVTLAGNRRVISGLNPADLTVVVDVTDITRTGNFSRPMSVSYPSRTDTSSITAEVTNPETISFYVDKLDRKTVEVTGVFNGSVAEGYSADPLVFSPGTVLVYGPGQVLANVAQAFVEVTRTDVDRTVTFESTYVLLDAEGNVFESDELTFESDTVSVTLPVKAVKEVDLTVDLVAGGGVIEENISNNVKWKLEPSVITLSGDSDVLAGVNNISVARIELADVDAPLTETYRIVIPNDTEIISGSRETVLTLEVTGLVKQAFRVTQFGCINVSEGYEAEILNDSLEIILRGPEEALRSLSPANIRVVADLAGYGTATGIVAVPARIEIAGAPSVGALHEDDYSVYVSITEAEGTAE